MARRRTRTAEGRGALIAAAIHRAHLAEHMGYHRGQRLELADEDPAMARLTEEERRWVRDHLAGRGNRQGTLITIIEDRFGPWDPDDPEPHALGGFASIVTRPVPPRKVVPL